MLALLAVLVGPALQSKQGHMALTAGENMVYA
jgi:hypothetical protein